MKANICYANKLEELKNFNWISVLNFNKTFTSDIISGTPLRRYPEKVSVKKFLWKKLIDNPDLPEEVLKLLRESEDDVISHEGVVYKKVVDSDEEVYYDSFVDMTKSVQDILNTPEIKKTLFLLENCIRKVIRTRDLISMPGFKPIKSQFGEISLSFKDDFPKGGNLRECKIVLNFVKDGLQFNHELGTLVYFIYRSK